MKRKLIMALVAYLNFCKANIGHGYKSMEDIDPEEIENNFPIELEEGLIVIVVKRPKKCIRMATRSDMLTVHYEGRFENETGEIFDYSRGEGGAGQFRFHLGAGDVIEGYERGAPGMCKGETRIFIVPPLLGYGAEGYAGRIPPNSTLYFNVECLSVADGPPVRRRDVEVTHAEF